MTAPHRAKPRPKLASPGAWPAINPSRMRPIRTPSAASRAAAMMVADVMTSPAASCLPSANLAEVSAVMWAHDCGIIPVVDAETGAPVGVVTDRDICIAVTTRGCVASAIGAADVMTRDLVVCRSDDILAVALHAMEARRVRRLPVVGAAGHLVGIVSLSDIVVRCGEEPAGLAGVDASEILRALAAIGGHAALPAPVA
jgi:CBS domain-containing protein